MKEHEGDVKIDIFQLFDSIGFKDKKIKRQLWQFKIFAISFHSLLFITNDFLFRQQQFSIFLHFHPHLRFFRDTAD